MKTGKNIIRKSRIGKGKRKRKGERKGKRIREEVAGRK